MFAGFITRWAIPWACTASKASAISVEPDYCRKISITLKTLSMSEMAVSCWINLFLSHFKTVARLVIRDLETKEIVN